MAYPDSKTVLFRQLFDKSSSTYTYLLADKKTREALIIDPVREQSERDLKLISELNLKLKYSIETHIHADHVTGAHLLKKSTGCQIFVSAMAKAKNCDGVFKDGERISFGDQELKVIATPGHTSTCTSFYMNGMVFTGDTLFIRGCGRTDFQEGSSETLFESVRKKLFTLPPETLVFPGHDYKGMMCSTIEEERQHNPRLKETNSKEQFVDIMKNLKLDYPAQIDVALPANLLCGFPN